MKHRTFFFPLGALALGLALALTLPSCRAIKQVPYFQDVDSLLPVQVADVQNVTLRKGDQISIMVHSRDPELSKMFNLVQSASMGGSNRESFYTLNQDGEINFPVLGLLKVEGMSRAELAAYIRERLLTEDLLKDPVVIVEFRNLSYYVMGEVGQPGRHAIDRDHLTIIEALATAGDLGLDGRRTNVLLLRDNYGEQQAYRFNLNKLESIYNSPAYYIQQNDIIYVQPSAKATRAASQNAGYFANIMSWTSIVSFLLSMFLLVRNIMPAQE